MIETAKAYALERSHDPDTKVGVVIVDRTLFIPMALGANRIPYGVRIYHERLVRPEKYDFMIHAEIDALMKLPRRSPDQLDMYIWASRPIFPCPACALAIVTSGIKRLYVAPMARDDRAQTILDEAGVKYEAI